MTLRDDYEHWARCFPRRMGEGWGDFLDAVSLSSLHDLTFSRCHLTKSSGASQNIGGANGTITDITWDQQEEISGDFTHNTVTNNDRIYFGFDGRVHVKASVSGDQTGANRTTLAIYGLMNTATNIIRAKHRNYSRGSNYGDISLIWDTEINVSDGDYLRIRTEVDDTDATYTINTLYNECEVIVTRIA